MKVLIAIFTIILLSCNAQRNQVSHPLITKIENQGGIYTVFAYSKETGKLAASFERLPRGYAEGRRIIVKKIDSCYLYLNPLLK